ncbi:hypothetical protein GR212_30485 [Rhizobium lusitanum]|uniref:Uncharacterized protein n=1 Tax=Rhizobium lusitanum TaxID=293958 RepID=A0A6L9UH11_9HYPH|nr:hypothetical protein [Rhizobium lusitanum]NEI73888.1 hypothetical protein [Rhizobium lusitanum]
MARLRHFFRLSAQRDDIETKLLLREFSALFLEDPFEDGTDKELRAKCAELSAAISSRRFRHRH